jgi:hypothetical protein
MKVVRTYGPAIVWASIFACLLGFALDAPAWAAVGFGAVLGLISIGHDMLVMALDLLLRKRDG